jgi:hypothetical protein
MVGGAHQELQANSNGHSVKKGVSGKQERGGRFRPIVLKNY